MAIQTLNQFADQDHRRMVTEYGVTLTEAQTLYPVWGYGPAWWRYVLESFEAGDDFSRQAIATLNQAQLRDLSRTTRGLREGLPKSYLLAGNTLALKDVA